jgi:peptide/nickel transport system substrate-binding protein
VRQAFSYALNRQRIVDSVLAGYGRATSTTWPPQAIGYDVVQDHTYDYDLRKAGELLVAAGWSSNTTIPLRVTSNLPADVAIGEIYQTDLAAVGVSAIVQPGSSAELLALVEKHQIGGALITGMGLMNLSPATFFTSNLYARAPNPSNFTSDRYTSLIEQAVDASDDAQLKGVVYELTQVMLDEAFLLPIAQTQGAPGDADVAHSAVKNVAWNSFGIYAFEDVWLDH